MCAYTILAIPINCAWGHYLLVSWAVSLATFGLDTESKQNDDAQSAVLHRVDKTEKETIPVTSSVMRFT